MLLKLEILSRSITCKMMIMKTSAIFYCINDPAKRHRLDISLSLNIMWLVDLLVSARLDHLLFSNLTVKQALGLSPRSSNCNPVCAELKGLWCMGFKGLLLMFHKLLACNNVTLWHWKLSIACPTSSLHYNKHSLTYTHTHTHLLRLLPSLGKLTAWVL